MRTIISFFVFVAASLAAFPALAQVTPGETVSAVSLPESELQNIKFDLAAYGEVGYGNKMNVYEDGNPYIGEATDINRAAYHSVGAEARIAVPVSPRTTLGVRVTYVQREVSRTDSYGFNYLSNLSSSNYDFLQERIPVYHEEKWEGMIIGQYHTSDRSEVFSVGVGISHTDAYSTSETRTVRSPVSLYQYPKIYSRESNTDLEVGIGYERQVTVSSRLGGAFHVAHSLDSSLTFDNTAFPLQAYDTQAIDTYEISLGIFGERLLSENTMLRVDLEAKSFWNGARYVGVSPTVTLFNILTVGPEVSLRVRSPQRFEGDLYKSPTDSARYTSQRDNAFFFGLQARVRIGGHL